MFGDGVFTGHKLTRYVDRPMVEMTGLLQRGRLLTCGGFVKSAWSAAHSGEGR